MIVKRMQFWQQPFQEIARELAQSGRRDLAQVLVAFAEVETQIQAPAITDKIEDGGELSIGPFVFTREVIADAPQTEKWSVTMSRSVEVGPQPGNEELWEEEREDPAKQALLVLHLLKILAGLDMAASAKASVDKLNKQSGKESRIIRPYSTLGTVQ